MVRKKNILITGANGQLGTAFKKISCQSDYNFLFKEKKDLDITSYFNLKEFLNENKVNVLINCAAYTNVNNAKKNKDISNDVNNTAVGNIAKLCYELNIQLVHISTDYVFDGLKKTPYNELDKTNPQNYYGLTKLNGEKKILSYNLTNSVIIRTSWLYSDLSNNFVTKILTKLKNENDIFILDNEIGSPTNSLDLAISIMDIIPKISNSKTEIYHFSNLGYCSRYKFAKKIKELSNINCEVHPIKITKQKIKRPKFSALDSSKIIKNFKIDISSWEASLELHLNKNRINNYDHV